MSKYGTEPFSAAVFQIATEVAALAMEEYKDAMSVLYISTDGGYGYPFKETHSPPPAVLEATGDRNRDLPFIDYEDEEEEEEAPAPPPTRSHQAPGGPGRRRRAAKLSRRYRRLRVDTFAEEEGQRYRIGWNSYFSVMPLSPKGRAYHRWLRR